MGVNGSIDRYGVVGETQSCAILNAYIQDKDIVGHRVSDANGVTKNLISENLLGVAEILGLTNGKLVIPPRQ